MKKIIKRDQVIAAFLGVCIGDALGAPVETMKREEIKNVLGEGGVTTYLPKHLQDKEWTRGLRFGATTDDWALTAAMAETIIKDPKHISLVSCVDAHLRAFAATPIEFDKTTCESMLRWLSGAEDLEPLYTYEEAYAEKRSGNGPIMKLLPLAILGIATDSSLATVEALTLASRITHRDVRSIVLAYAVYQYALLSEWGYHARANEIILSLTSACHVFLKKTFSLERIDQELFTEDIKRSLRSITFDIQSLPSGFTAMETAPFVISVCHHASSFKDGVLQAVNAGGGTDTHGSIVGGILGLRYGTEAIPEEWIDGCLTAPEARDLANRLCDVLSIE